MKLYEKLLVGVATILLAYGALWAYAQITKQAQVSVEVIPAAGTSDIVISNESLAFGQVEQGALAQGSFDMSNPGGSPVTGITMRSLGDGDILFNFSCLGGCGELAAGETKTVNVEMDVSATASLGSRLFPIEVAAP